MPDDRDDSLMSRFEQQGLRRFRARDAVIAVLLSALLLVLFEGRSVRKAGQQMKPGIGRDVILAVGGPAGAVADALPLASLAHEATAWLSPDRSLSSAPGGFDSRTTAAGGTPSPGATIGVASAASAGAASPGVTPDAFDPQAIGTRRPARKPLRTLLVTGDSMSTPLDSDLAAALASRHVHVIRDPHLGTGISKSDLVDWGKLASAQVQANHPDAVVVFIGANEGFPMAGPDARQVPCCGAEWAAIYANRARQMATTYRQRGAARVYWVTLPAPRDSDRQQIARVVNAALAVALAPWAAQVRVVDTVPVFTPGFRYRDSISVGASQRIVREPDGIHLNDTGSSLLAAVLLRRLADDFVY